MADRATGSRFVGNRARRVNRRSVLGGAAGALAAGAAARVGAARPAVAQGKRATFVLVPGQWTGGFIWHKVARLLREAGHDAFPVTCTGLGERVHLANAAIDLDVFITDVVNVMEYEDLHDVVLVGHSFGGMIVTGVAERAPERLSQIVYFDADVPTDGQNDYDFLTPEKRDAEILADVTGGVEAGMPGFRPVFPGVKDWVRSMIPDQDEAEWFISRLVPHPELTNLQRLQLGNPAAAALPKAFILCTADKDLTADPQTDPLVLAAERARNDPNWRVIELDGNHVANLIDPEGTVDAFLSLL